MRVEEWMDDVHVPGEDRQLNSESESCGMYVNVCVYMSCGEYAQLYSESDSCGVYVCMCVCVTW